MKIINIGILAHVDAGKTTLTESLLYASGAISEPGSVEKGTTRTDTMFLERQRGITIQAAVTSFQWHRCKVNIVDTPGHMDFLAEVYRSLAVLDGAILVISAKDGVQAQTRILFHALRKMNIPTVIFINKIDQAGVDLQSVVQSVRDKLSADIIIKQTVSLSPEIVLEENTDIEAWDAVIENNDELLEKYIAGEPISREKLAREEQQRVQDASLFPVYHGSAKNGLGIASFIPYIAVYFMIRSIIGVFPNLDQLDMGMVMNYGWLALAGIVANILLYFLAIFSSHMAAFGTLYELKVLFADHITKIPLGYHLTIGSGRLRKIMDENIESVEGFIAHQFPDFVASITAPIVMVIILLAVDWRFGLASLVGIILAFVAEFIGFGSGEMKENMGKYQKALEEMNNASVEYVRGMSVVKAFNQTASSFKKLKEAITGYTEWVLKFSLGWQNCMPAFTTIINNVYLILVPVGILIGSRSDDFAGFAMTFIFYLLFVPAISGVLNKIMYISESFMQIDGNVARMDEILNIPEMLETSHPTKPVGDDVAFHNVSFSYTGDVSEKALENVSFSAKQGQITAIVGPSGGGKSTIANLISRFWDVSSGSITIGGVDVRDMAEDDLMRHVSFVFQDIFLFKQSILDNIRMGNPSASEEQVIAAAKAAQCHEFISKLPGGYHTVVGSKGTHLSGGERQRIAIARAIIKDSPIIVLDEATAFSDPENEYLIQKAFEKLMQGKTVIIIAHRLSTIRNADKIIVMEKGHLIEEGKHDELVAAGGRYAQMWNHYTEAIGWKISGKAV